MYILCFCTLCSYANCEWPVNKDLFCSVPKHGYRLVNAGRFQTFVSKHGYRLVNAGKL